MKSFKANINLLIELTGHILYQQTLQRLKVLPQSRNHASLNAYCDLGISADEYYV